MLADRHNEVAQQQLACATALRGLKARTLSRPAHEHLDHNKRTCSARAARVQRACRVCAARTQCTCSARAARVQCARCAHATRVHRIYSTRAARMQRARSAHAVRMQRTPVHTRWSAARDLSAAREAARLDHQSAVDGAAQRLGDAARGGVLSHVDTERRSNL